MLSGETSVGAYPVRTVATMSRIVEKTEELGLARIQTINWQLDSITGAVTKSALSIAEITGATHVVSCTLSGDTARRLARHRDSVPLVTFTPVEKTAHALTLLWGTAVFQLLDYDDTAGMLRRIDTKLVERGVCQPGDLIVVVFGELGGESGTNSLNVHTVQDPASS